MKKPDLRKEYTWLAVLIVTICVSLFFGCCYLSNWYYENWRYQNRIVLGAKHIYDNIEPGKRDEYIRMTYVDPRDREMIRRELKLLEESEGRGTTRFDM